MLYPDTDHLSVWEVAHRWHGFDPNTTDPKALPLAVQDTLRTITRMQFGHELTVCNKRGIVLKDQRSLVDFENFLVPEFTKSNQSEHDEVCETTGETIRVVVSELYEDPESGLTDEQRWDRYEEFSENWVKRHNALVKDFPKCFNERVYDKATLEQVHIDKAAVKELAESRQIPLPEFWFTDSEKKQDLLKLAGNEAKEETPQSSGRINQEQINEFWQKLSDKQKHRLLCREIAKELWRVSPTRTIADICRDEGIQIYGGGRYFTKTDTLREWIKDLDPRPNENKKGGRPPAK
jgi:hypothetical protein